MTTYENIGPATPERAIELMSSHTPVTFVSPGTGDAITVGHIVSFSDTPVVLIESPSGCRMMAGVENIREATEDEWLTVLPSQTPQRDEEKSPAQLARELLLLAQETPDSPGRSVHVEGTERILQAAQTYALLAIAEALNSQSRGHSVTVNNPLPTPSEARMTLEELTTEVDRIIQIGDAGDNEVAHGDEDELHLKLLTQFLPDEWRAQIGRLTAAPFSRWYA